MSYQLYRNTTLGQSLQEALEELIQAQQVDPDLALNILLQFDKTINAALANRLQTRMLFKGHLRTYRFCDSVWTLVVENGEFREVGNDSNTFKVDKLKVVACDGKAGNIERE